MALWRSSASALWLTVYLRQKGGERVDAEGLENQLIFLFFYNVPALFRADAISFQRIAPSRYLSR